MHPTLLSLNPWSSHTNGLWPILKLYIFAYPQAVELISNLMCTIPIVFFDVSGYAII